MRTTDFNNRGLVKKLRKGQLWKLKRSYVYIVALQGSGILFKLMDSPAEMGERTLTSGVDTLSRYLLSRKGKLVSFGRKIVEPQYCRAR